MASRHEKEFIDYVTHHWAELLDNVETIPSIKGNADYAAEVVGLAAEDLAPMEYVDFMDRFLDLYEQRRITDQALERQLMGVGRKNLFLRVNYEHPRVAKIFRRANLLVPPENGELHDLITDDRNGVGADMYQANVGDDAPPPETLPGIELKAPFESPVAKNRTRLIRKIDPEDKALDAPGAAGRTFAGAIVANPVRGAAALSLIALPLFCAFRIFQVSKKRRLGKRASD